MLVVSHLDTLKLVAQDFHAARMLGLGCIDANMDLDTQVFVYAAIYLTWTWQDGALHVTENVSLSLPTSMLDQRLPVRPELRLRLRPGDHELDRDALADRRRGLRALRRRADRQPHQDAVPLRLRHRRVLRLRPGVLPGRHHAPHPDRGQVPPAGQGRVAEAGAQPRSRLSQQSRSSRVGRLSGAQPGAGLHPQGDASGHPRIRHLRRQLVLAGLKSQQLLATDATAFPKRNTLLPPHNAAAQVIQEEARRCSRPRPSSSAWPR